jgi:rhodanese-related sulfurtransferase
LTPQHQDFGFKPSSRLEAIAQYADEKEGNSEHPAIIQQSCSDSPGFANPMDGVFGTDNLQHMRRAGLVANRCDGKFVYYRLADAAVLDLLAALRRIAERNVAEVERLVRSYFDERDGLEAVSREELLERSRAGTVTILDVRPDDEFALGHLPGALNIPLRELEAPLGEIDRRLLSRSLLRAVLRSSRTAPRTRLQGAPIARMARHRAAGGNWQRLIAPETTGFLVARKDRYVVRYPRRRRPASSYEHARSIIFSHGGVLTVC